MKNLGFHIVTTFAIQLHIKDWEEFLFICRNSAALVQWLCLVLQLSLSHLNGGCIAIPDRACGQEWCCLDKGVFFSVKSHNFSFRVIACPSMR